MNKSIKYGLVAGITMAGFALTPIMATQATGGEYVCGSSEAITSGSTITLTSDATGCTIKVSFSNEILDTNALTVTGISFDDTESNSDYTSSSAGVM